MERSSYTVSFFNNPSIKANPASEKHASSKELPLASVAQLVSASDC